MNTDDGALDLVIAVVGGTGGLGRALHREFERRGATVVALSRSTTPSIDVRNHRAGDALVEHVVGRHGRLDAVVVASGIVAFGDLADTDDVVIEELLLVNAMGPLWLARRCLPALAASKGCFVAITGVVAETPQAGMAAYSSSKAALAAGLAAVRREFRRQGVAVIDARPPHTETGLATRPLAGVAPRLPAGLEPAAVATLIADAVAQRRDEIPSSAFG
ncbi:MAG: SDR family NAD(P)-dependent oxidoreductase [Ilumatobacteraceae bacterium]